MPLEADRPRGIMLADYHLVRRYKLKLNELYIGNASSIYWYRGGVNWRAPVAFFAGVWPLLRKFGAPYGMRSCADLCEAGLAGTVNAYTDPSFTGWIRLYNLTFLIGTLISFTVMATLCYISPPPGLGQEAPFVEVTDSVEASEVDLTDRIVVSAAGNGHGKTFTEV